MIIITYMTKEGAPCGLRTWDLPRLDATDPLMALRFYRDQCGAIIEGKARDILMGRVAT